MSTTTETKVPSLLDELDAMAVGHSAFLCRMTHEEILARIEEMGGTGLERHSYLNWYALVLNLAGRVQYPDVYPIGRDDAEDGVQKRYR